MQKLPYVQAKDSSVLGALQSMGRPMAWHAGYIM